jgi:tRNA pseudouridine55 synthase
MSDSHSNGCTTSGFLLINKEQGMTSHRVLSPLKRIFSGRIGHTGTLDPMATGMLVCAIGEATRFIQYLDPNARKCYHASIQLGKTTDTLDITGQCILESPVPTLDIEKITKTMAKFTGKITQKPPIYSALKYQGKPYYYYARKGKSIPIPSRQVDIDKINHISYDSSAQQIHFTAWVSAGTYIRTLASDIAEALGTHGCLSKLHRAEIAPWVDCRMWQVDTVSNSQTPALYCQSIESGLTHLEFMTLSTTECERLGHGIKCKTTQSSTPLLRLLDDNHNFRGLIKIEDGWIKPVKILLNPPSRQQNA